MEYLNESGLARIKSHMDKYDTGMLTAFRSFKRDGKGILQDGEEGRDEVLYTKKENQQRNMSLRAKIMKSGYKITTRYEEGVHIMEIRFDVPDETRRKKMDEQICVVPEDEQPSSE